MVRRVNYLPVTGKQFHESLLDCLAHLYLLKQSYSVFGVLFFILPEVSSDYVVKRRFIEHNLSQNAWNIPYSILPLSLNVPVQLECWISDQPGETTYQISNGIKYTRFTTEKEKIIWIPGITCQSPNWSLHKQIDFAFSRLYSLLKNEGMSLSDIIRQWHYMPETKTANHKKKRLQPYQLLDEIRQNWFSKSLMTEGYPAISGISMANRLFSLDTIAFRSDISIRKTSLSNKFQPYLVDVVQPIFKEDILIDSPVHPSFLEFAKSVETPVQKMIFVSGTCAIVGQENVSSKDIENQTSLATDYLTRLIAAEVSKKSTTYKYIYIRVYLKNNNDFERVKQLCDVSFPEASITYLRATSCNKTLLVEIEGEAVPY
jgi:enamine deaminase RidA (YjgF/YER057c/UK114 family)